MPLPALGSAQVRAYTMTGHIVLKHIGFFLQEPMLCRHSPTAFLALQQHHSETASCRQQERGSRVYIYIYIYTYVYTL